MNKTLETEVKVGLFVTVGLGLIMLAIILLGGVESWFSRHVAYFSHFPQADGLIIGSKVNLNGLQVGVVEAVTFDRTKNNIRVDFKIKRNYQEMITQTSVAEIATQGVLGDKYISLMAGDLGSPALLPGSEVLSQAEGGLSGFLDQGGQVMETLKSISTNLNKILGSFTANGRNEVFFKSLADASQNVSGITKKLNQEMEQIKINESIAALHSILKKIDAGKGTLGALVNDPDLYNDARTLLGGVNRNRVVRNLIRQTIKENEEEIMKQE